MDMNNDILYIEKAKLIESIIDIKDIDVIKKLRSFVTKSAKLPAVMTVEELKAEVMQGVEDARNGKGTPQDEFFKEMDKW
jgi:hypothetical protein